MSPGFSHSRYAPTDEGSRLDYSVGDLVLVHVTNLLDQPTTVHFHGLTQNGTNWADGPSGLTQCPISPGGTYTYEFPITGELQYGTYVSCGAFGVTGKT